MLDEMRVCVERHGIRNFIFWGELVSMHPDHLHELCDGILASGLDVLWMAAARADQFDEALVAKMRRSGSNGMSCSETRSPPQDAPRPSHPVSTC